MNKYIHSHLSYDQIILDDDPQELPIQSNTEIKPVKQKPFSIRRNKYTYTNQFQKHSLTDQTTQISKGRQQKVQQIVNSGQSQTNQYRSDFQPFQQQLQQSIAHQISDNEFSNESKIGNLRRSHNHSAILPYSKKISMFAQTKHRYSQVSKKTQQMSKSTIQLRQQNKRMVRSIEALRRILPEYRKNQIVLNDQRKQLKKIKYDRSKIFDVTYQFNLEKNLINKRDFIEATHRNIESTQRIIRHRDKSSILKRGRRIGKAIQIKINPQQEPNEFLILRQQILYKRRQEERHLRILAELDDKIHQYNAMIQQLQERQKVGLHQQLSRKKIVIQYDIQMQKTKNQNKQCQLMLSISQLNHTCSEIQIKIAKLNSQILSISLQKTQVSQKSPQLGHNANQRNQPIPANYPGKKVSQRLMRLFKRRC